MKVVAVLLYFVIALWSFSTIVMVGMPREAVIVIGFVLLFGLTWFTTITFFQPNQVGAEWHQLDESRPAPRNGEKSFMGYHGVVDGFFEKRRVCLAKAYYGEQINRPKLESKIVVMELNVPSHARFSVKGIANLPDTNQSSASPQSAKLVVLDENGEAVHTAETDQPAAAQRFKIYCTPKDLIQPLLNRPKFWTYLEQLTGDTTIEVRDGRLRFEQMVPLNDNQDSTQVLRFLDDLADRLEVYYA
ncbi:MAG: hypothetical protein AAF702_27845 [Chloroflexota bacterium]